MNALNYQDYRGIFDAVNDAIFVHDLDTGVVLNVNQKMFEMYGYTPEEALGSLDVLLSEPPYSGDDALRLFRKAVDGPQIFEWLARHKDGHRFWVEVNLKRAKISGKDRILAVVRDISERKRADEQLRASEARYRELADSLPEVVFEIDDKGNLAFSNRNAFDFFGCTQEDFDKGINVLDYIVPGDRNRVIQSIAKIMKGERPDKNEYMAQKKDGSTFPITIHSTPIFKDNRPVGLRGFLVDITRRKKMEEQLKTISIHDSLTGLYNRAHFEHELQRLENNGYELASIIMCDVDGLKLVNDTLGHDRGDALLVAAAGVIKRSLRESDIIARIGGDEFVVILPNCGLSILKKACGRIRNNIASYNTTCPELPLSISIGSASSREKSLRELYREADNNMYREKLDRRHNERSTIVRTFLKALEAKDFITEGHADRLQELVAVLGAAACVPECGIADLRLFSRFHDIGKVGVPDRILFKPGVLSAEEAAEMQRHCEIGYRIAQSALDLILIADWILKHHEWWDGNGYPLGLKGEEIPLECRIFAIADAYDSMTNDRPYRKALTHGQAVAELNRCAGTQFDARLVSLFVSAINTITADA